jgi:uncharacterized MnhB-related membrane protein
MTTVKFALGSDVETQAQVPTAKPWPLQALGLATLLGVTAALVAVLLNDPGAIAAACAGAGLLLCVFCMLVWISGVLGLGVGPAQLMQILRMVARALRDWNKTTKDLERTPDKPGITT